MNATIKNSLIFHNNENSNATMFSTFNMILQSITLSDNFEELIQRFGDVMENPISRRYFNFSFDYNSKTLNLTQRSLRTPSRDEVRVNPKEVILTVG